MHTLQGEPVSNTDIRPKISLEEHTQHRLQHAAWYMMRLKLGLQVGLAMDLVCNYAIEAIESLPCAHGTVKVWAR